MMDKSQIILRLTQLASERGGHISYRAFVEAIGVPEKWLPGQVWFQGWNALLEEIGLQTKSFGVDKTPLIEIAKSVAVLITKAGKWPTEAELRREKKTDPNFPSVGVISPVRRNGDLARLIVELGSTQAEFAYAAEIAARHQVQSPRLTGTEEKIKGYVYMLRSGRSYKIGKSGDPSRRFREVKIELPQETNQVHAIATDDPTGIEVYWHKRFAEKRVRNTEFFLLNADDVRAFKRRNYQ